MRIKPNRPWLCEVRPLILLIVNISIIFNVSIIVFTIIIIIIIIILIKVRHMWEGSPAEETIMKELTQENGEVFPEKYGKIN